MSRKGPKVGQGMLDFVEDYKVYKVSMYANLGILATLCACYWSSGILSVIYK